MIIFKTINYKILKKNKLIIILILLTSAILSCNPNGKEIDNAKATLDLARKNNNLDQMYLSLRQLKSLGNNADEINIELSKVESGIEISNELTINKNSHYHEKVVKSAASLLELFPNHPEAIKSLKESGLIFSYLKKSREYIDSCFKQNMENEFILIPPERSTGYDIKINYEKILFNLGEAEKLISSAKNLDPQFEKILKLEKMTKSIKNSLAFRLSNNILKRSLFVTDYMSSFYNMTYSGMNDDLEEGLAPSNYWKKAEPYIREVKKIIIPVVKEMNILSSYLSNYKLTDDMEFLRFVKELNIKTTEYVDSITNPKDSILDYKRDYNFRLSEIQELFARVNTSLPNKNMVSKSITSFGSTIYHYKILETPKDTEAILKKYKITA